jgi:hypothetical protein
MFFYYLLGMKKNVNSTDLSLSAIYTLLMIIMAARSKA